MENRVREYRNELGMTQQELADLAKVTSRTIISLEGGRYKPSIMLAYRISLVFEKSIEDIFCLEDNLAKEDGNDESI